MKKYIILLLLIVSFDYQYVNAQILPVSYALPLTATQGYQPTSFKASSLANNNGYVIASGNYTVYPAKDNYSGKIIKPFIIAEGFDPENTSSPDDYYYLLNINRLSDDLRKDGYDIIILDYANGSDYIQRNAFLLMELITKINKEKTTNNEIVLTGVSMGGLVSRYCLAYMESHNINHQVKLFISYDSPHKGANMPMGLQAFVGDAFASQWLTTQTFPQWKVLNSGAAQQMLVFNFNYRTHPLRKSAFYTNFMSEMNALGNCGFPANTRKIAVSLGNLDGIGLNNHYNHLNKSIAGTQAFYFILGGLQAVEVSTLLSFNAGDNSMLDNIGMPRNGCGHVEYSNGYFMNNILCYQEAQGSNIDVAPGGKLDAFKKAYEGVQYAMASYTFEGEIYQDDACFIPTISALAYNENDYFYKISNDNLQTQLSKTPFDDFYRGYNSDENSSHTGLIPYFVGQWMYDEIKVSNKNICKSPYLLLNNSIIDGNYGWDIQKASNTILALNYVVKNDGKANLKATNRIILSSGFKAKEGSFFRANLEPCTDNKSCISSQRLGEEIAENDILERENDNVNTNSIRTKPFLNTINLSDPFPNPANNQTNISFSFDGEGGNDAFLIVYTLQSNKEVARIPLKSTSNQIILDTSQFSDGIYGCTLRVNGINKGFTKLLILH